LKELVFASNNLNKLREIALLMPNNMLLKGLADIGCREELEENQPTLEGNAVQKARYVHQQYKVNCFADDTGLEIEALAGRPGVYSARYAGGQKSAEDNMNKVLLEMKGMTNRKARFRTVIALCMEGKAFLFEGLVNGTISESKQGVGGFGYDPVFIPEGGSETFASMDITEKNKISHRAIAMDALIKHLIKV
jgi:XTP/dITP diphosphohydrolase